MALTFETHDDAPADDVRVVDAALGAANDDAAPLRDVERLCCFARDESGTVVGGAVGRTWGSCGELQQLWVAPAQRKRGVGARLVRMFEARAQERGCRTFYLTTFSFQAPRLYAALGYRVAHELRGFPDGIVRYDMVRELDSENA